MTQVVARANSNVALAKYWGKRNECLNLSYTGSVSITLAGLLTTVSVRFTNALAIDRIVLNGASAADREAVRISDFLDLVRQAAGVSDRAEIEVQTNFPVAAGLASSASTFAALAMAASNAAGLSQSPRELSVLARRGSGSAARSIFGGYVEWQPGEADNGTDSYAVQLAPSDYWALGIVVAITEEGRKLVGSREGMTRAVKDSPFFAAWLESHRGDLDDVRHAIRERDLPRLGRVTEHNCLKMHAVCLAARPPLIYWTPVTLAVMQRVVQLRTDGCNAYFTIDAGPQVKIICPMSQRAAVAAAIQNVSGVQRVLLSEPGPGAELMEAA